MKSYNIALMPGDGTGPEVLEEGVKVLNAVGAKYGSRSTIPTTISAASATSAPAKRCRTAPWPSLKSTTPSFWAPSAIPTSSPASWNWAFCSSCGSLSTSTSTCGRSSSTRTWKRRSRTKGRRAHRFRRDPRKHRAASTPAWAAPPWWARRTRSPPRSCSTRGPIVERCMRYAYDYTRKRNNEEDADPRPQVQCADLCGRPVGPRAQGDGRRATTRTSSRTTTTLTPAPCGW